MFTKFVLTFFPALGNKPNLKRILARAGDGIYSFWSVTVMVLPYCK